MEARIGQSGSAATPQTCDEWVASGCAHLLEGRTSDAIGCFRRAAAADPNAPLPLFRLGEALLQAGSRVDAMAAWGAALRLAPGFVGPGETRALAHRYAEWCGTIFRAPFALTWPRRTRGTRLRVVALLATTVEVAAANAMAALAALPENQFDLTIAIVGSSNPGLDHRPAGAWRRELVFPQTVDIGTAMRVAALDPDVLVDLAGQLGPTGPLLARRPARHLVTVAGLANPSFAPLVDDTVPTESLGPVLNDMQRAIDAAVGGPDAESMVNLWTSAVSLHQQGALAEARERYRQVLDLQPGYAPAHYLYGVVLRDAGEPVAARREFVAAVAAAPDYADARIAAADAALAAGDAPAAIALCEAGRARSIATAPLFRTLGLARLATREGAAAVDAFERALALASDDPETHYDYGIALQLQGRASDAAEAYRRSLALRPGFVPAQFNLGVLDYERGLTEAAAGAFAKVLEADPRNVAAYKNLGEILFAAGRFDAYFANFRRFEAKCPDALPLAVQALEACHYLGEFDRLDRYLERIAGGRFVPRDQTELVDCLEQLLYLLLYFDVAPSTMLQLARSYDVAARHVYGEPMVPSATRTPGRLRIGYLSADLRNHVMGKMMWAALQHHDKARFALHFYSLSATEDEWTDRFRGLADRFHRIEDLDERAAARRIAADDLDLLVDLSTHTKGAKPGILALKPARVQITHVASAGTVGLSTIDFKLTDRYADLDESAAWQIERPLAMEGCVYPYRHIAPPNEHPFHRERFGLSSRAVVIGAFASGLKLSRRCLALWRDILERIPGAVLAFSPVALSQRPLYARLAEVAGIAADRIAFVPQGRDDGENQARYTLVDFVLDPMPYGGTNGTLEALDMGVPVVTLVGSRHAERTSYSILTNLGLLETIARTERDYVEIAVQLANDPAFGQRVRAQIAAGMARSPLTDMRAHTRNLERAYLTALELRSPDALGTNAANGSR